MFVPSRGQCRTTALDLLTHCALETESENGYLPLQFSANDLQPQINKLRDASLADYITKGVGFFHEGVHKADRALILGLYAEGIVRVLLVPRDACWALPVSAGIVIVLSTQYVHVAGEGAERQVREYGLDELVRMQGRAVRHGEAGHFHLFCQAEDKDTYMRFLEEGLPLESRLLDTDELRQWYKDWRRRGLIKNTEQAVQALSFTFLAQRLARNPAYYDATGSRDETLSRLVDVLEGGLTVEVAQPEQ